jgi:biotin-dependent carboxylase-like uncharacterized protein
MSGSIEVVNAGMGNGIQDNGRLGYRHMGITVSGHLDPLLARCANALVGNAPEAACIEVRALGVLGFFHAGGGLGGAATATPQLTRSGGEPEAVAPWTSLLLEEGDELETGYVRGGIAYVAVSGGITTPVQLGSRSTYQRALIGGVKGRLLAKGDVLPVGVLADREQGERRAPPWVYEDAPIRVVLGPQEGHFKPESVQDFLNSEYTVTPQMDRMGMRIEGPALIHRTPACADIVSDGVTPGVLQVPGNGQPIILLADCQTVGGYPKIATVISADLPRIAQLKPGQKLRFRSVTAAEARAARIECEARWQDWQNRIEVFVPAEDEDEDYCVAM